MKMKIRKYMSRYEPTLTFPAYECMIADSTLAESAPSFWWRISRESGDEALTRHVSAQYPIGWCCVRPRQCLAPRFNFHLGSVRLVKTLHQQDVVWSASFMAKEYANKNQ